MFLRSDVTSITGNMIYSDSYFLIKKTNQGWVNELPLLNRMAKIPIFGVIAGVIRMILALIHIIGHLLAAILTCNKEHLPHVAKGFTELLRGAIEVVPIFGNCFAWKMDPGYMRNSSARSSISERDKDVEHSRFFLIHIYHPRKLDMNFIALHYISLGFLSRDEFTFRRCFVKAKMQFTA